jgi:hypothetical protein
MSRSPVAVLAAATACFGVAYAGGTLARDRSDDGPVRRPTPAAVAPAAGLRTVALGEAARLPGLRTPTAARRPTMPARTGAPATAGSATRAPVARSAPRRAAAGPPASAPVRRPAASRPAPAASQPAPTAAKAPAAAGQPVTFFDDGE